MKKEQMLLEGLPLYKGGRVSLNLYASGEGLCDSRPQKDSFLPFCNGAFVSKEEFESKVNQLIEQYKGRWENSQEGVLSAKVYPNRRMLQLRHKNGVACAFYVDKYVKCEELKQKFLRSVIETSKKEFLEYIENLKSAGFEIVYQNKIEKNIYFGLKNAQRELYAYFTEGDKTARFIDGSVGTNICDFGYKSNADDRCEVYQYALKQASRVDGFVTDCGMLYIIKLSDNSFFLVDGGAYEQATDAAVFEIYSFLRRRAELKDGDKIRIAAWFCTHAHSDHMDMFSKLIRLYHEDIELERVIFNFPARENYYFEPSKYICINRINEYYPKVEYLKAHSGHSFCLANAKFLVLQTHEDFVAFGGNEKQEDFNDTSTVIKVEFDGKSFLLLGDINKNGEAQLLKHYTSKTLKSDIVQAAHHVFNMLNYIYDVANPKYIVAPTRPEGKTNSDKYKYQRLILSCGEENVFYACEEGTHGFAVQNGSLERFYHEELKGTQYDGSDL